MTRGESQRGGGLFNRYVAVAESGVSLDEECELNLARNISFVTRDGVARELRTVAVALMDEYGKPEFVLGIAEDITELSAARAQPERHANHDALTGLPNRRLFMDRLEQDGTRAEALIRRADDALYRAKDSGRNTYQHFSAMPDGDPAHRTGFKRARGFLQTEPSCSVDEVSSG